MFPDLAALFNLRPPPPSPAPAPRSPNEDFADGFLGLMGNPHSIGEAFQITNDESLTWNQIYGIVADCLGVELKAYHVASEFLASVTPKPS